MSDVAIDACCLLNLVAAGNVLSATEVTESESVSREFPYVLHVPDIVEGEALYVYQPDEETPDNLVKKPVDIRNMINACILQGCSLQAGEESDLFVRLAVRLDDGEAACLAIAKSRSWVLATDDRVARRLSCELGVPTLSTAELVKHWSEQSDVSDDEIAMSLRNIQRLARFRPRSDSPESEWWFSHVSKA